MAKNAKEGLVRKSPSMILKIMTKSKRIARLNLNVVGLLEKK